MYSKWEKSFKLITNVLPRVSREEQKKKRKLEVPEKYLPQGKRMVSASIRQEREKQKKKGETIAASQGRKSKSSILVSAVPKPMESSEFKELAAKNVIRKEWSRSIGSGTFGTYRGISVVRDCAIIIRSGGAEKLELSSKNLDSTPLQNKKN